jgi:hypothetical protein
MSNEKDALQGLPQPVNDAVATEVKPQGLLHRLGFRESDDGDMTTENCRVTFYSAFGEYEIDIVLPNGSAVGFDVPIEAVRGRTADEIFADRAAPVAEGDDT